MINVPRSSVMMSSELGSFGGLPESVEFLSSTEKMFARIVEAIWCTLVQIYKEFSLESSIHGVKYTVTAKSASARFFWVIILISFLLTSMKLATLFYVQHESASMRTLVISEQFPISQLALPAVTLCSGSLAVKQKVVPFFTSHKRMYIPRGLSREDFQNSIKYIREAVYPKNHYPDELDKLHEILSANRLSLLDLLETISPNCTDLLVMCRFEGNSIPCENLFHTVVTSHGICCSFNYENPYERIGSTAASAELKTAIFGDQFILSVLMKPTASQDRISSLMYGDGIKVIVHDRHTVPTISSTEFGAAARSETIVRLEGTRYTSSSEILNLPVKTRACMTSTPGKIYRVENCYLRCRETAIRELCGCVPFFFPNIDNREEICTLAHTACLARITLKIEQFIMESSHCNCLPNCESIVYRVDTTASGLSGLNYCPGELYRKARQVENATILHFTFASQSGIWQRNQLMLSKVNLVASLGGVFSLFLGCSFISLFEIIYFIVITVLGKLKYCNRIHSR